MADKYSEAAPLGDLEERVFQRSITGEYKLPGDEEEAKEDKEEEKKKKKKKRYRLRPEDLEMILNFGHDDEFPATTNMDRLAKEKGGVYQELSSKVATLQAFSLQYTDSIRAAQEKVRHEFLTKGYATYFGTDEEEDEEEGQQGAGGSDRGQRRNGPGVSTPAEGV